MLNVTRRTSPWLKGFHLRQTPNEQNIKFSHSQNFYQISHFSIPLNLPPTTKNFNNKHVKKLIIKKTPNINKPLRADNMQRKVLSLNGKKVSYYVLQRNEFKNLLERAQFNEALTIFNTILLPSILKFNSGHDVIIAQQKEMTIILKYCTNNGAITEAKQIFNIFKSQNQERCKSVGLAHT